MSIKNLSASEKITQFYYDSKDADEFYWQTWGGENIHIGIYDDKSNNIKTASQNTTKKLLDLGKKYLKTSSPKIADLGSGYGGVSRYLCKELNAEVSAINISEIENNRHQILNTQYGLAEKINILHASFEDIPLQEKYFDLIWCQDALLHSSNKPKFFSEVSRIMKNDSYFILTDILQNENVQSFEIKEILDRIKLNSMGTFNTYKNLSEKNSLKIIHWENRTDMLVRHYSEVLKKLNDSKKQLMNSISESFIDNMSRGLDLWVKGGMNNKINWGIFLFKKSSDIKP